MEISVRSRAETATLSGSFTTDAAPAETAAPIVSATGFSVDAAGVAAVVWDLSWPGTGADTAALSLAWGLEPGPMDRTNALEAAAIPAVEVHMSNIQARDDFRRTSLTAPACIGQIAGLGADGYELALRALVRRLSAEPKP